MKLKQSLACCVLAVGLVAGRAQNATSNPPAQSGPAAASPAASAVAKPAFSEAQIVEELGWFYGKKMGLSELGFSKGELEGLIKGMTTAAEGKDSPYQLDKIGPGVDEFMQKKQAAYMAKVAQMKQKNANDGTAYLAKMKENKNVVALPDGLLYEIVQPGSGPYPKPEDTVKVNYTGRLIDGTVFDSSEQHGQAAEFGLKDVIPGWTEGIQKINKGGKIRLYIPPQLGYGDNPNGAIPPGSVLTFDVELLEITAGVAPTPASAAPQTK